jgi:hypothetical protein
MCEPTNTVMCHYRLIAGREGEFLEVQREHDRVLRKLDLVTAEPMVVYQGHDEQGRAFMYKVFDWKSPEALEAAHSHPEVMLIWERMESYCETRDGRPAMEFPHVERVVL